MVQQPPSNQTPSAPLPSDRRSIPNCLYQYSLHSAYSLGATSDGPPASFLTEYGDYAFCLLPDGTPLALIDSKPYRFDSANKASTPSPTTRLAFAMICLFTPENRIVTGGGDTVANLRENFSKGKYCESDGRNHPIPFAVRGAFRQVTTTRGEMGPVQGTVFGFVVPKWMEGVSGLGVRCCFLSGCHRKGGEVVDFESISGTFIEWAVSDNCHIGFPRDEKFETMEL